MLTSDGVRPKCLETHDQIQQLFFFLFDSMWLWGWPLFFYKIAYYNREQEPILSEHILILKFENMFLDLFLVFDLG